MTNALYILTLVTTLLCAALFFRAYLKTRKRLLLYGGLSFVGLAISNFTTIADLLLEPVIDLYTYRLACATISMTFVLFSLLWKRQ